MNNKMDNEMDSNLLIIDSNNIKALIYTIRGKQVMLDSDLAKLYQVQTKVLNQAVRRNTKRFPELFMFRLTNNEINLVRSQNVTSPENKLFKGQEGGRRYLPYCFTEQGIAMLSAVLKSEVSQKIFFDGQIYDAFTLLVDIVQKAKKSIVLIDNYVGIDTLNILAKRNDGVKITIYTTDSSKLTREDVDKFNKQYKNLIVKKIATFHDRFIILDENYGYLIGSSLKDAGNKSFGITRIEDDRNIKDILERL